MVSTRQTTPVKRAAACAAAAKISAAKAAACTMAGRKVELTRRRVAYEKHKARCQQSRELLMNLQDFNELMGVASFPAAASLDGSPLCRLSLDVHAAILWMCQLQNRAQANLALCVRDLADAKDLVDNPDKPRPASPRLPRKLNFSKREAESEESTEEIPEYALYSLPQE